MYGLEYGQADVDERSRLVQSLATRHDHTHTHTHTRHVTACHTLAVSFHPLVIRLEVRLKEARLHPNIGFTLRRVLAVFTRSAITRPKVN